MLSRFASIVVLFALPLLADEYLVLRSGFRMSAQNIEKKENVYCLTSAVG